MSRHASRWSLLLGPVVLLACGPDADQSSEAGLAEGTRPGPRTILVAEHPSEWSCQRYGDVTDEGGDSYDSQAAERAEEYLSDTVSSVLRDRGLEADPEDLDRARMVGLLNEICMESPDLVLEAAALKVVDGLP